MHVCEVLFKLGSFFVIIVLRSHGYIVLSHSLFLGKVLGSNIVDELTKVVIVVIVLHLISVTRNILILSCGYILINYRVLTGFD